MKNPKIQDPLISVGIPQRFFAVCLVILATLLTACATQYGAAPFPGASGYSEQEIKPNIMRVSYLSGHTVSSTDLEPFALYRCAELTIARGLKRFTVLDRRAQHSTAITNSWAYVAFLIEMHNSTETTTNTGGKRSYDAQELLIELRPKIKTKA